MTQENPSDVEPSPSEARAPHERSLPWKCLQVFARIGCTLMFDLKVYGSEHVPAEGGVLLVSNHQSYLDPVLLAVKLPRPMSYLAKSQLFKNKYFAWIIRSLNAFPVKQGKGDKGAIEETIRRLKAGYLLNVFPEGSRTEDGEIAPIQRGVALVVRRAMVPIVPAVIDGSFQSWPRGQKLFRAHRIRVLYGPPLKIDGMKADAIVATIDTTLRSMLRESRERSSQEMTWW